MNIEGTDNKNIDGIGLVGLDIFNLFSVNIDRVRCVLTIFSVLNQLWSVQQVTVKMCVVYYFVSARHTQIYQFYGVSLKECCNNENGNAACDEFVTILKEIVKDATREDVKKKIS
jgi:hypothetical protein